MEKNDVMIYAVIDEYHIPFAITTDEKHAEELLEEWLLDFATYDVDEDGEFMCETDAMVWHERLGEFLESNPNLLTPQQVDELLRGDTIMLD
jgi:hypothetical protein